jgi:hypothetical protein
MKGTIATVIILAMLVLDSSFISAAPSAAPAINSPVDLRGIYIYTNDISQLTVASAGQLTSALGVDGVDGVNLVFGWDSIEPRSGIYQWDASNGLSWSSATTYVRGDEVSSGPEIYVSLNDGNLGHSPVPGKGNWQSTNTYLLGDEVNFNQYTYVSLTNGNIGNQPNQGCTTDCTAWQPVWNAVGTNKNLLDEWIASAINSNKKIALTVPAGSSIPSWLFQVGAKPLNFTISPHAGVTGVCQAETIAAPWDPAFLTQWDAMLAALANHLKTTFVNGESEYDAIQTLRLTGINRTTEELRLPAETPQSTGLSCVSDAIATWQAAHYKPSRLLKGWNSITDSFINSFPDKSFSVSIIPQDPFPPIDDHGQVIMGQVPDQNHALIKSASEKLPGRLVVQFDFLLPGDPASAVVLKYAHNLGTLAAFQTNEWLGGQGAACTGQIGSPTNPPMPCATSDDYLALLNTGIYPKGQNKILRAQYIEVFRANVNAFPPAIQTGHEELITSPFVALTFPDPPAGGYTAPVTGSFTASSAVAVDIKKITCRHASVTNVVGLDTINASATVTVSTAGDPVRVSCTATDVDGNRGRSLRLMVINPGP